MSTGIETPVLVTTDARDDPRVAGQEDGDTLALRVEITGSRGADYTYDLAFEALGEASEGERSTSRATCRSGSRPRAWST